MVGTVRRITIRRGKGGMSRTCIVMAKLVEDQLEAHVPMSLIMEVVGLSAYLGSVGSSAVDWDKGTGTTVAT